MMKGSDGEDFLATRTIHFSQWLEKLGQDFHEITEEERNQTLDYLIEQSSSTQLYHLSDKLPLLVKRDFLRFLPCELVSYLLGYLDGPTLLKCCTVSPTWNRIVNESYAAWRKSSVEVGACLKYITSSLGCNIGDMVPFYRAQEYKRIYLHTVNKLQKMKSDQTFGRVVLKGHQSRIMAIYHRDGKVATGCDDHTVRLWEVATGRCLLKFVTNSVSDVKFDDKFIFTASFDNTGACWDINTGTLIQNYVGHIAAIFSIDFDAHRDLVVTGAADRMIILWQLSTGELLHSISGHHSSWVMKVKLLPSSVSPTVVGNTCINLISACSNMAFIWTVTVEENKYRVVRVNTVHKPPANYALHQSFEVKDNTSYFYLSDRHSRDGYLYCSPVNQNIESPSDKCNLIHLNGNHDVLLGIGRRFAVFVDFQDTDTVKIVDLHRKETIAQHYLPPCRPSRNGSTFTLGNCDWLDGIGEKTSGLFLAACTKSNDILLLKWKD